MKTGQFIHERLGLVRWTATWDPEAPPPYPPPEDEPQRRGAGTVHFWDPFDTWLGAATFDNWAHVRAAPVADTGAITGALQWFENRGIHLQEESTPTKTLQRAIENWFGDAARDIAGVTIEDQSNAS
jgi:hypothetical protein